MEEKLDFTGLKDGMVVSNYKKMCELLGDRVRSGTAKKYQLERWKRHFEYKREGRNYKITKVYDDYAGNNIIKRRRGKYLQYIEPVLIDYICRNGGDEYCIRLIRKKLFCVVGMVNENYLYIGKIGDLYGDIMGFEIEDETKNNLILPNGEEINCEYVYWFKNKTTKRFGSIIDSSLKSMEKRGIITIGYEYVIVYTNKTGDICNRIASEAEIKAIKSAEEDVLKEMDIKVTAKIKHIGMTRKFYDQVNEKLKDKYGWQSVFYRTIITLNKKYATGGKIRKEQELALKRRINKKIISYLAEEAVKDKEIYDKGNYPYNPNSWKSKALNEILENDDFLEVQKKISDYLIKI